MLSGDLTVTSNVASGLVWVSGIEARIQNNCSLSDCITSALDSVRGLLSMCSFPTSALLYILSCPL